MEYKNDKMKLSALEQQVLRFIRQEKLLASGNRVLAAVSGGADSVCLMLILKRLEKLLGIHMEAVTVHHGIRGKSADRDVEFVRELCSAYEIPVHVCRVDVPGIVKSQQISQEEAARQARYECFAHVAGETGAQVIAVAHHRDDNCETILHHLFRGSSLKGLGGMDPRRKMGDFSVIRPFLETGRQEIESWLKERDIVWRTDETNLEDDYTRNRMRHHVIPLVENEINGQASAHVVQAAGYIAQAQELVEELAGQWLKMHGNYDAQRKIFEIPAALLKDCRPIVRREIFIQICRKIMGNAELKDVGHVHLEMIEKLRQGQTSRRLELPGGIHVRKEYDRLVFCRTGHEKTGETSLGGRDLTDRDTINNYCSAEGMNPFILSDGRIVENHNPELSEGIRFRIFSYNGEKIPENGYTKWFDYDTIKNGLSLRTRRTGDYFLLDGGGKKTVKSYMIDQKIPADRRDSVLLLTEGSHVLWLSDGRISAAYKVNRDTHSVLELIYLKEERLS